MKKKSMAGYTSDIDCLDSYHSNLNDKEYNTITDAMLIHLANSCYDQNLDGNKPPTMMSGTSVEHSFSSCLFCDESNEVIDFNIEMDAESGSQLLKYQLAIMIPTLASLIYHLKLMIPAQAS